MAMESVKLNHNPSVPVAQRALAQLGQGPVDALDHSVQVALRAQVREGLVEVQALVPSV